MLKTNEGLFMDANALIGMELGSNYILQKVIGQGEMGAVFLARQFRPDRQVAVKVLLPIFPLPSEQYTAFLKRFQYEIDAVASLKHANIAQIYESGEYEGLTYLVMPYISGGTLRDEMEREGPFSLQKALSYLEQMASALDFAHEHGVIHGNVQPANILVQYEGHLVLTDFGMVKVIYEGNLTGSFLIRARMPIETLDYMAPEQVLGDKIGPPTDLYSLGVVLYQMLTGTVPFQNSRVAQHQYIHPYAPRLLRPDLSVTAEQAMLKALSIHPTDRYMCAKDFASAFRQALIASGIMQKSVSDMSGRGEPKAANLLKSANVLDSTLPATTRLDKDSPVSMSLETRSVSPTSQSNKNLPRTDVIKKTSFTIPSLSGFWQSPVSQVPTVPEVPLVVSQEENTPPPPMEVSWPDWGWPAAGRADFSFTAQPTVADFPLQSTSRERSGASDIHSSGRLAAQKTKLSSERKRLFAAMLIVVVLALLVSGSFIYVNSRAATPIMKYSAPGSVQVPKASASSVSGGVYTSPVANGGSNGNTTSNSAASGSRSFQVGAHPLIVIKGHGSDVNIHVGNMNTVIVTAKQRGSSNDTGVLYNQVNDGQGHDRISIAASAGYMNVDYNITAPSTALVQVEVDSGSIAVDGVSGVTIDTGGGNLDIADVHGPVNVHTENGDITARALTGSMEMEVGNGGSIRVNNVNGTLTAVSHNGDVVVRGAVLNGSSILETNYGSVSFEGSIDPQGTYTMKTINGNVALTLPGNTAFQLAASVGSGSIYNAFGSSLVGNAPRAQIMVNIENGSVTVNRAV